MSIYKESRAAITILIPIKIIAMFDHEKDITTNSSPIKLIFQVELGLFSLLVIIRLLLVGGTFVGFRLGLLFGNGPGNLNLPGRTIQRI